MANFNLNDYETVASRINRFWTDHPTGRIHTEIVSITDTGGIFKASIYTDREDERPVTIDFAEEVKGSNPVNRTSWVENGLTSAVGRALANLNYQAKANGTIQRPSREEMEKVQRAESWAPAKGPAAPATW